MHTHKNPEKPSYGRDYRPKSEQNGVTRYPGALPSFQPDLQDLRGELRRLGLRADQVDAYMQRGAETITEAERRELSGPERRRMVMDTLAAIRNEAKRLLRSGDDTLAQHNARNTDDDPRIAYNDNQRRAGRELRAQSHRVNRGGKTTAHSIPHGRRLDMKTR